MRVTHPFHPLYGKDFVMLDHRRAWGEDRVYIEDDKGRLRRLPASWTSAGTPDAFVEVSAGRSYWRVEDLLRLSELIRRLGESLAGERRARKRRQGVSGK